MNSWEISYRRWLQSPHLTEEEKTALGALDRETLRARFQAPLSFGTAGLRGIMALGPGAVNRFTMAQVGLAFGRFLLDTWGEQARQRGVCLCYDCRRHSPTFAQIMGAALSSLMLPVYIFAAPRPTPTLSFAVRQTGSVGGINITSSHNAKEYNGCKLYSATGAQLTDEECQAVSRKMDAITLPFALPRENPDLLHFLGEEMDEAYLNAVIGQMPPYPLSPAQRASLKIVYTPLHGVGGLLLPRLLESQGFTDLHCVPAQFAPDGNFPTAPLPNPELPETFALALEEGKRLGAHLIIATDPDADRVAFQVLHKGRYHCLSGHQAGCLLTDFLLSSLQRAEALPPHPLVIKSLVTTELAQKIAQSYGAQCRSTFTGFKHMAALALKMEREQTGTCVIAFEEAIGCMIGHHCRDKDGLAAALAFCHLAALCHARGETPIDYLESLFRRFSYYREDAFSIPLSGEDPQRQRQELMGWLRAAPLSSLGPFSILSRRDYLSGLESAPDRKETNSLPLFGENMLYYTISGGCSFAIRPSGTEPKIKCYLLTHGESVSQAEEKLSLLRRSLAELLKG